MKQILSSSQAVQSIPDGATIMIGGFMCCGQPLELIDALLAQGTTNLTLICNDAGLPNMGIAKLIAAGRVKKLIASHIGLNPQAGDKMNKGEMQVELVPQGTLAERIRCAGAGLGGILTPTGCSTDVEKNKQKITLGNKDYLLEEALHADFSLIKANKCDKVGNAFIGKSMKNFNTVMSMAAKSTIAEAEEIVNIGDLNPDNITIPGVFINILVEATK